MKFFQFFLLLWYSLKFQCEKTIEFIFFSLYIFSAGRKSHFQIEMGIKKTKEMYKTILLMQILIGGCIMATEATSFDIKFDHIVDLDENFRLLWKVRDPEIIFEVQVRTKGYIGFGFSRSDYIYGSDIAIGWVDDKHTFFQVSKQIRCFNGYKQFQGISNVVFNIIEISFFFMIRKSKTWGSVCVSNIFEINFQSEYQSRNRKTFFAKHSRKCISFRP